MMKPKFSKGDLVELKYTRTECIRGSEILMTFKKGLIFLVVDVIPPTTQGFEPFYHLYHLEINDGKTKWRIMAYEDTLKKYGDEI